MMCGTFSSSPSRSTLIVIASSTDPGIKNLATGAGSESLKVSSAAQQRVAVDHGAMAGQGYERLVSRWRAVAAFEQAM